MSGSYDIYNYLEKGFYDDNVYFNNPAMYLKNLNDDYHLPRLRQADSIVIRSAPFASCQANEQANVAGIKERIVTTALASGQRSAARG